jgi:hypothetical protein
MYSLMNPVSVSVTFYAKRERITAYDTVKHPNNILPLSRGYDKTATWFSIEEDGQPGSTLVSIPHVSHKVFDA